MRENVRIVWWLTIISACLVIGMQIYWLHSQLVYATDNYASGLAKEIEEVMTEDYQSRNNKAKKAFTYRYNISSDYSEDKSNARNKVVISVGEKSKNLPLSLSLKQDKNGQLDSSSINDIQDIQWKKTDTFDIKATESIFYNALSHYIAEAKSPLNKEKVDSLIAERIPEITCTSFLFRSDSILWDMQWQKTGTLLAPSMELIYPYSPLENKDMSFSIQIPVNPLLRDMLFQLVLGFVFISILIGCLLFQLRIIFRQRELNALQYSFVNTMIHELRRPVQTLKMLISFLNNKDTETDKNMREQVVQDSFHELDSLSAYLTKLKDMARVDNGEFLLNTKPFIIRESIEKTLRTVQKPSGKVINFSVNCMPPELTIEADPVHLSNLLTNLVENAIKYSGSEVQIRIEAEMKNKSFRLRVADNGIGISRSEQEQVFEKFYRGNNVSKNEIPGVGLGLSYVKLIVEAHHGTIDLKSRLGEGTSILIQLPQ